MKRIVVGISGASGVIYGVRVLQVLNELDIETDLVITSAAVKNLQIETDETQASLERLATRVHNVEDFTSAIASGSHKTDGMIVAPCSIKTLSAISNSYDHNLLVRAADVTLKERRRLVILVRETPLHEGHLELMLRTTRMGAIIMPPVPAFYHMPATIGDIIDQSVGKALDFFDIDAKLFNRWKSPEKMRIITSAVA